MNDSRALFLMFVLLLFSYEIQAQYPFEKFPAILYKEFEDWKEYDRLEKEQRIHFTLTIPDFYTNHDTVTIQLTGFQDQMDTSLIRVFRNKNLIGKIKEPMFFISTNVKDHPVSVADINGDSLDDIKLVIPYMGNGIASLNVRVIYFFQKTDGSFDKISFLDKMDGPERDFNADNNFEIITMTLDQYESHSYWTFNIYNFENGTLVNQNQKYGYPIMIQFLYRDNYAVTNKISAEKMKSFERALPKNFDKK
ncbi:hypothetical protein SAMN04488109_6795 [Chryseolinea serpens]|uniref:Uncharacterized protein n=1 Tax=Chryseolinea serpens TaxID=947013 RepID=A0A1M5XP39_9BACT|nr:hypothetical protein [Chryseolinea serpens]SHI01570.1 hypothetical protein SAMN04488109_6795 [Chryseolinea serpens]